MDWIPAIDNIEARLALDSIDRTALATGNLDPLNADRVLEDIARPIVRFQPKKIRKPRNKGESPF